MITTSEVVPDTGEKESYMDAWCRDTEEKWADCKRFITKASMGFCPDFVVPDTAMSIEEIIEKFDEQS